MNWALQKGCADAIALEYLRREGLQSGWVYIQERIGMFGKIFIGTTTTNIVIGDDVAVAATNVVTTITTTMKMAKPQVSFSIFGSMEGSHENQKK